MMPVTASTASASPILTRPLSWRRSGCRMSRTARTTRTTGTSTASTPTAPAVTAWITLPAAPERPNHSRAAMTTARASRSRATPSLRSAGSSPRASLPIRRSVPPIRWAIPSHSPRSIRTGHGARDCCGARPDRPPVPAVGRLPDLADRADRAGEVVRVAIVSSKRCVADAPASPLDHITTRLSPADTREGPDSAHRQDGSGGEKSDTERDEPGDEEDRADGQENDQPARPFASAPQGGEEEAGRHDDGRAQRTGPREPCPPTGQAGGLGEQQADQPQDDEHPGMGVAGAEEGRLERGGGDVTADDASHEVAAGRHGGGRQDGDARGGECGLGKFEHGDLLELI